MALALPDFVLTVVLVTASGALTPGPLFVATLAHGAKAGARGGFAAAVGHTLVEFPLILLLAVGLFSVATVPLAQTVIGVIGGVALLGFGGVQLRSAIRYDVSKSPAAVRGRRSAVPLEVIFTALNPFFLLWWFTVGSKLILDALALALVGGVLVMYASHVWMDYAFLSVSAYLAGRGTNLLGAQRYRWVILGLALVLFYFGASFLWAALSVLA